MLWRHRKGFWRFPTVSERFPGVSKRFPKVSGTVVEVSGCFRSGCGGFLRFPKVCVGSSSSSFICFRAVLEASRFSNFFNSISFENFLGVIMSYYYVVFVDKVFIRFVFVFTVMMLVHDIFIFILHLFVVFVVGIIFVLHRFFRLFLNFLLVFLTPILQAISICPYFLFFFCISIPNIFDRCQVSLEILYF